MDVDYQPEIVEAHLGEALVAQDAGIVDKDIDALPAAEGLLDHGGDGSFVGHRACDGERRPAGRLDLGDDAVGSLLRQVIYDQLRSVPREIESVRTA